MTCAVCFSRRACTMANEKIKCIEKICTAFVHEDDVIVVPCRVGNYLIDKLDGDITVKYVGEEYE